VGRIDYPIGYVRWTEQRNFQACLDLMAKGRIHLAALTNSSGAVRRCALGYQDLMQEGTKDVGVVLEYDEGFKFEASSLRPGEPAEPAPSKIGYRNSKLGARGSASGRHRRGNFARQCCCRIGRRLFQIQNFRRGSR